MPRNQFTPGKIYTKLRKAEVFINQGMIVVEVIWQLEIGVQTYYQLQKEYG